MSVFDTIRSAEASTVVSATAVLSDGSGSGSSDVTDTVFVSNPACVDDGTS